MDTNQSLPATLENVRSIDRTVFDIGRKHSLRAMEVYLLTALNNTDGHMTTADMARSISASTSQAKQVALRLQERGLVLRVSPRFGLTRITSDGEALIAVIETEIKNALAS